MNSFDKPIYLTQPALPPLEELNVYLRQIWDNKILTNNSPFYKQFEKELSDYLGVNYLSLFADGTLALVTSLQEQDGYAQLRIVMVPDYYIKLKVMKGIGNIEFQKLQ